MTKDYLNVADTLKIEGYEFEMGKYLSEGWKKGTPVIGWFLLFLILSVVFSKALGLISNPIVGYILNNWVISPALSAGLILFMQKKYNTNQSDFGLIFKGFTTNFGQVILVNILIALISILALLPFILSFLAAFDFEALKEVAEKINDITAIKEVYAIFLSSMDALGVGLFISMALVLILTVFFSLSNYFVVVGGLTAVASLGASFGVVKKAFFPILGFFIVLGLINVLGLICLVVGVLVTLPVTIMAIYAMFHHIVASKVTDDLSAVSDDDILDA
jgi:hypothetical protein